MGAHDSIGERIAYYRKRRGLTQTVLAGRVGRSKSWLTKVERGELVMDRLSTLLLLANALKVEPGALIGGVSLPPNGGAPLDPPRGIIAVRRALLTIRPPDREPPDPIELRAAVERVVRERFTLGRPESSVVLLPELIEASRTAVAEDLPEGWWCLAGVCRVASSLAGIFGETQVAWIAADRSVAAAQRSDDEVMVASASRRLAFAVLSEGLVDDAAGVCSDAADALAPTNAAESAAWSLWGSLHLTGAVAAARADDAAAARRLLRDARAAAERVGPGRDDYSEAFSPANVGAHEVAVALEAGDAVEALRLADSVDPAELSHERRATFLVDIARAHGLRRNDAATVALLLEGERYAPQMVRCSVKARELVRVCLRRERRSHTPGLRALAERLGVVG